MRHHFRDGYLVIANQCQRLRQVFSGPRVGCDQRNFVAPKIKKRDWHIDAGSGRGKKQQRTAAID